MPATICRNSLRERVGGVIRPYFGESLGRRDIAAGKSAGPVGPVVAKYIIFLGERPDAVLLSSSKMRNAHPAKGRRLRFVPGLHREADV